MKAESAYIAARGRGLPLPFDAQAQRELALMAKRRGEHAAAAEIWQGLLSDENQGCAAYEELAIYHERRTKNYKKALEFARSGLKLLRSATVTLKYGSAIRMELRRAERLLKRVVRLEARIKSEAQNEAAPLLRHKKSFAAAD